jgi:hypothetical protein
MATAGQAARHICLSVSRFRDLVDSGVIARAAPGKYDLTTVRESYIPHMQKLAAGRGADHGAALSTQRARLAAAQTLVAEQKIGMLSGEFVRLSVVQRVGESIFGGMREIALSMPARATGALAGFFAEKDRDRVFGVLYDHVFEMLEALSMPDLIMQSTKRGRNADAIDETKEPEAA